MRGRAVAFWLSQCWQHGVFRKHEAFKTENRSNWFQNCCCWSGICHHHQTTWPPAGVVLKQNFANNDTHMDKTNKILYVLPAVSSSWSGQQPPVQNPEPATNSSNDDKLCFNCSGVHSRSRGLWDHMRGPAVQRYSQSRHQISGATRYEASDWTPRVFELSPPAFQRWSFSTSF